MSFSAVILAGGQSQRMGHDKALLVASGRTWVEWQVDRARQAGAVELWIATRPGTAHKELGVPLLFDPAQGQGPLAGLVEGLRHASVLPLLALAVDLPSMTADFLRRLRARCRDGQGVVPVREGRWEPLAAFYPHALLPLAEARLAARQFRLQDLVQSAFDAGLVQAYAVDAEDRQVLDDCDAPPELSHVNA